MLIGLAGYARSGKDTIGKILVERGFQRVAFADKLREFALAIDPIIWDRPRFRLSDVVEVEGWEGAKENPEVRSLLQRLGTEAGRNILGEDVWVNAALDIPPGDYVITDVRFPNELEAIRSRGGQVWLVSRPGYGPINGHPSETALSGCRFDHVICNDFDIEHMKEQVLEALTKEVVV
jgi:hypothetical protein